MNEKILVIIVTFNGMKWIDRCIQSILSSSIHSDIFVIDNASSDSTPVYVAKKYPSAHLVQNQKNLGFGQANNIGLQYAIDHSYDYVYLLNQDAWVKEDTFEKMILVQKQHPEYGVLSPIQLDGTEQHFDYDFGEGISLWTKKTKVCEDLFFKRSIEVVSIPMVMAAHWLISKECLKSVGGFSPAFYHYGEDNNYADRVRHNGYKLGIVMNARAIHDRANRVDSDEKKCHMMLCSKIHHISGFDFSAKHVIWDYTREILLKILFDRKKLFSYLICYKSFILNIPKYRRLKKSSLEKGAFLNIGEENAS